MFPLCSCYGFQTKNYYSDYAIKKFKPGFVLGKKTLRITPTTPGDQTICLSCGKSHHRDKADVMGNSLAFHLQLHPHPQTSKYQQIYLPWGLVAQILKDTVYTFCWAVLPFLRYHPWCEGFIKKPTNGLLPLSQPSVICRKNSWLLGGQAWLIWNLCLTSKSSQELHAILTSQTHCASPRKRKQAE